jgi:4-carboxymuconolactone decarboxylase
MDCFEGYMKMRFLTALTFLALGPIGFLQAQDRMSPISSAKMTNAQRKAAADYKDIRKSDLTAPPRSVILRVPDLVVPSLQIRLHYLSSPALNPKLAEFAVLVAARRYTDNYVWNAHSPAAEKAALSGSTIGAVADGRRPGQMTANENQSVTDASYAHAITKFGEAGVVDAASIEGYYGVFVDDYECRTFALTRERQGVIETIPQIESEILITRIAVHYSF